MKKLLLLFFAAFLVHSLSIAQLRIALVGGGHSASVNETNDLPDWNEVKSKYSSRTGAHFGFMADLQLGSKSKFWFQPGIIYYNKGRKFFSSYDTTVYDYFSISSEQFINYIDFPLNLTAKFPLSGKSKLFIGAGPYFSFFYNGREKTETFLKDGGVTTEENTDLAVGDGPGKYKTLDAGVNGTVGVEFGRIFIAANFSRGLTDFYKAAYDGSFKHQVIGGTLGIFLGKPVELENKIKDRDKDAVVDNEDLCPDEPGSPASNGCPDADADGIADKTDKCPSQKGLVKYSGCPVPDTDGDGVSDEEDKCINVPGLVAYKGCPVTDTDKDGINDEEDKCKDVPGFGRYEGCPVPDSDGDGLNDETDKCPKAAGTKENNGCPITAEVSKEIKQKVEYAAKRIQFKFGKAELLPESKIVLDEVAGILLKNPELKLVIEGHTSSDGNLDANMKLSDARAAAVRDYIISKGVNASRLSSKGFGPTQPLNEGKTEVERALNRRVELKPANN